MATEAEAQSHICCICSYDNDPNQTGTTVATPENPTFEQKCAEHIKNDFKDFGFQCSSKHIYARGVFQLNAMTNAFQCTGIRLVDEGHNVSDRSFSNLLLCTLINKPKEGEKCKDGYCEVIRGCSGLGNLAELLQPKKTNQQSLEMAFEKFGDVETTGNQIHYQS